MADKFKKPRKYLTKRKSIVLSVVILAIVSFLVAYMISSREGGPKVSDDATPQPMDVLSKEDISKKIEETQDESEKAALYLDLASTEQGKDAAQEALDAALTSIELKPSHESYAMAGAIYRDMGNNEKALEMYRKAIELTEKTEDSSVVSPYNNYRLEINELEG